MCVGGTYFDSHFKIHPIMAGELKRWDLKAAVHIALSVGKQRL